MAPRAYRQAPAHVDETYDAPLPAQCPHCAGALRYERVAIKSQEELPVQWLLVRQFRVAVGRCLRVTVGSKDGTRGKPPTPSAPPACSWGRRRSRWPCC